MPPKSKQGPRVPPSSDEPPSDLRRTDQPETPPDSLPEADEEIPIAGQSPSEDGGVEDHPIHDEPEEDFTPGDYERQIDDVARARRGRTNEKP